MGFRVPPLHIIFGSENADFDLLILKRLILNTELTVITFHFADALHEHNNKDLKETPVLEAPAIILSGVKLTLNNYMYAQYCAVAGCMTLYAYGPAAGTTAVQAFRVPCNTFFLSQCQRKTEDYNCLLMLIVYIVYYSCADVHKNKKAKRTPKIPSPAPAAMLSGDVHKNKKAKRTPKIPSPAPAAVLSGDVHKNKKAKRAPKIPSPAPAAVLSGVKMNLILHSYKKIVLYC